MKGADNLEQPPATVTKESASEKPLEEKPEVGSKRASQLLLSQALTAGLNDPS